MLIGYIYLYGEEYKEWEKYNKPLPEIITELLEIGCDKIYMDVFLEDYTFPEIERLDMLQLFTRIVDNPNSDDQLVIRGRMDDKRTQKDIDSKLQKELKRICNRTHRQI